MTIRQPIVTVIGHVDHGKTSILDSIRSSAVASKEAGGITQKISFTSYPAEIINKRCRELLEKFKINIDIPGFLFIDTPGHAAFTNLRKRGGSLADLAILVIDINEGLMPQTIESINILKTNKTPFVIAINKIDAVGGWQKKNEDIMKNFNSQSEFAKKNFENKLYKIIGSLSEFGFDSDLFFRINDFTKQISLIPCSGKTGEGIQELVVMLSGLSQRFLKGKLEIHKEAKGSIIEVKREKENIYIEAIIYDGSISVNDTIVIAGLENPVVTKVRSLFEALPLAKGFKAEKTVNAAAGIRMQTPNADKILPGMPFLVSDDIKKASSEIQKEISESINLDDEGVAVKADSLGSLEALIAMLRDKNIRIKKAGIGNINKLDAAASSSNFNDDPLNAVVLGFNVSVNNDVKEADVKILANDVVYKLIEDLEKWKKERAVEIEREKLKGLTMPCKIKILPFVFRQSHPAIFGVNIEKGVLKTGIDLIDGNGEKVDNVKAIQSENKSAEKADKGKEVAISLPNTNFNRKLKKGQTLYSDMSEYNFRVLKENKKLLNQEEIILLQEIADIKRKTKATWGL